MTGQCPKHSERGFSIAELVVALGIFGLVALTGMQLYSMFAASEATGGALNASHGELMRLSNRLRSYYYVGADTLLNFSARTMLPLNNASRKAWRYSYTTWGFEIGNQCVDIPAAHTSVVPSFNKASMIAAVTQATGSADCGNQAFTGAINCGANQQTVAYIDSTNRPREYFPVNLRLAADGGSQARALNNMPVIGVVCRQNFFPPTWDQYTLLMGYIDGSRRSDPDPWKRLRWVRQMVRLPPASSYSGSVAIMP